MRRNAKIIQSFFLLVCLVFLGLFSLFVGFFLKNNWFYASLLFPQAFFVISYKAISFDKRYLVFLSEIIYAVLSFFIISSDKFILVFLLLACMRFFLLKIIGMDIFKNEPKWKSHATDIVYVLCNSLLVVMVLSFLRFPLGMDVSWVITTGLLTLVGMLIVLSIFEIWQFFIPLAYSSKKKISLRRLISANFIMLSILLYLLFFVFEVFISEVSPSLTSIIMLFPSIYLTCLFYWYGACFSVIINSIILLAIRYLGVFTHTDDEILALITLQGCICFFIAVMLSRQKLLMKQSQILLMQIKQELKIKNKLVHKLVTLEEEIKKNIARELHDEVGQNITAIQIHAHMIERSSLQEVEKESAKQIYKLSKNIHLFIKSILSKLRPSVLDEVGLKQAIYQLSYDLNFEGRGIKISINIEIDESYLDDLTKISLYRISQELLNNIVKYSQTTFVEYQLVLDKFLTLSIKDNGISYSQSWRSKGYGLKGIQERVSALGGAFRYIPSNEHNRHNQVIVTLLTKDK